MVRTDETQGIETDLPLGQGTAKQLKKAGRETGGGCTEHEKLLSRTPPCLLALEGRNQYLPKKVHGSYAGLAELVLSLRDSRENIGCFEELT